MSDDETYAEIMRKLDERTVTLLSVERVRVMTHYPAGVRWDSAEAKVWPMCHSAFPSWLDRTQCDEWCRLSKSQQRTIATLVRGIMEHDGLDREGYEYKSLEVTFDTQLHSVWLRTVVGRVGDEGTMAEVFCRTRRSIHIGRHGGCTLYNAARFVKRDGKLVKVSMKPQHGITGCMINITE